MDKKLYKELRKKHVLILNPATAHISPEAEFEPSVTIHSGVQIIGKTKIGSFSVIGANSVIKNSVIGKATLIKENCVIKNSTIENLCEIGPFAHLRSGTIIKNKAKIGNFVEIKNSVIGEETKVMHHAYIGEEKHKTIIEDNVFIGTHNSLVAPVKIGKGAYTAAGSVITEDVPPNSLAIARSRQVNKLNWKNKNNPK